MAAELEWEPPDLQRLLRTMAAVAQGMILQRAFPSTGPGRDVQNRPFKALSRSYAEYKSGTVQYQSDESRRRAIARRRASGKPGPGPLVDILGISTRLAPRSADANQRLTDLTAKGLGVVRESERSITLGFRDVRSQRVARHLQRRNRFWGLAPQEREALLTLARGAMRDVRDSIRIRGRIEVRITITGQ